MRRRCGMGMGGGLVFVLNEFDVAVWGDGVLARADMLSVK
jgi:hypothetical protein